MGGRDVRWERLNLEERNKDFGTVRAIPERVGIVGLGIVRTDWGPSEPCR